MSNLTTCPDCGREVSTRASACPHCGAPLAAGPTGTGGTKALGFALILVGMAMLAGSGAIQALGVVVGISGFAVFVFARFFD